MRIIDLHCYPGTEDWIACQGPMSRRSRSTGNASWIGKPEDEVIGEFTDAGVEACLVALDLETTIGTQPVGNDYVHAHVEAAPQAHHPVLGRARSGEERDRDPTKRAKRLSSYGFLGFHFHPIMQHFAVDEPRAATRCSRRSTSSARR